MIETTYLAADCISGVYKIDAVDYPEMELMSIIDFMGSLSGLSDDEIIFAAFGAESEDLYNEINNDYGIR